MWGPADVKPRLASARLAQGWFPCRSLAHQILVAMKMPLSAIYISI